MVGGSLVVEEGSVITHSTTSGVSLELWRRSDRSSKRVALGMVDGLRGSPILCRLLAECTSVELLPLLWSRVAASSLTRQA